MEYGGSRAAFRGEPEPIEPQPILELPVADADDVLDVEVLDPDEDSWPMPEPEFDSEPSPFVKTPAPDGMMSLEAAVSVASARNTLQHKVIRQ